jgi:hypothetical protein
VRLAAPLPCNLERRYAATQALRAPAMQASSGRELAVCIAKLAQGHTRGGQDALIAGFVDEAGEKTIP